MSLQVHREESRFWNASRVLLAACTSDAQRHHMIATMVHNAPLPHPPAVVRPDSRLNHPPACFAGAHLFTGIFKRMGLDGDNVFAMLSLLDNAQTLLSDAALDAGRRFVRWPMQTAERPWQWRQAPVG